MKATLLTRNTPKSRIKSPSKYLWDELSTWTERYDPETIGPALSAEQWAMFENAVTATVAFLDAARTARNVRRETA